jgi:predicted metal-dependent peptidase
MLQITTTLSSVVRIQKARATLLLDHPFFGTLLFRLGARSRTSIETMATDGVSLFFNPKFVETLSTAELIGTLAHETMHPALQHHTRRGSRNPKRWNMACDYAINPLLVEAGLTLPKDVLLDHRFRGMSAERIYNLLEAEEGRRSSTLRMTNRRRAGNRRVTGIPSQARAATRTDQALLRLRVVSVRFWTLLSRASAKVSP